MSNYRRLISYIYAYEGGIKGKNIGYAKVEVRGDQCRIHVNVKKVYVGSNDIGVYLLSPGAEILLGKIFIRGGAGEFRISVQSQNVEGSGYGMDQCYGLTVHDVESTWQSYTTIWEDAVAQAAEIQLAEVTSENIRAKEIPTKIPEENPEEAAQVLRFPVSEEIERELEEEELRLSAMAPWEPEEERAESAPSEPEQEMMDNVSPEPETEPESAPAPEEEPDTYPEPEIDVPPVGRRTAQSSGPRAMQGAVQQVIQSLVSGIMTGPEKTEKEVVLAGKEPFKTADGPTEASRVSQSAPASLPEPGDPAQLEALERQERQELGRGDLWNRLERQYPRVLAFDYDNGCEILSIKPQDIGLLPREMWVYGNNSFLLHGYYNYRHLILAKLNNPNGPCRYLLGVPGHYFSNEKYMASMFGFPRFVLAKRQPEEDGRFGYWYTDIRL